MAWNRIDMRRTNGRPSGNPCGNPLAALRRFGRNEDGTLVVFGLMLMLLMIMMGGIAVDVMRYETRRTSLQNTLDRSTLAAASLTQDRSPEAVVDDYFERAGLSQYLTSVTVTEGLNFRNVNATAVADSRPLFLHMLGVENFNAAGVSTAEQRITNVEIMLILDVSGSMNSNNRIGNLKVAAKNFVSSVLAKDVEHKISIGIVPFNGQVNLGPIVRSYFMMANLNGLPGSATQPGVDCVDLPASAYNTYAISQKTALSMTANVDTFTASSTSAPSEANKWCPVTDTSANPDIFYTGNPAGSGGNRVRLPQQDVATLQGYINGLTAIGATSINAGMKWGMTLMDPSVQNIYTAEMAAGRLPGTMEERPRAYDAEESMKVIVLMTDGENFPEEQVNAGYKSGPSTLWQSTASDKNWSIFHESEVNASSSSKLCASRPYYVPSYTPPKNSKITKWQSRPWNGTAPSETACYVPLAVPANVVNRTWPEVWATYTLQYVAKTFYATPLGENATTWTNKMRTKTDNVTGDTPIMDAQLQTACNAAKANGIVVYGIAFEAPSNGQTQIRSCATSPAHYFNANGSEISTAFTAIANNISQLRLTQ